MHRLDPELRKLDAMLEDCGAPRSREARVDRPSTCWSSQSLSTPGLAKESSSSEVGSVAQDIEAQIKTREDHEAETSDCGISKVIQGLVFLHPHGIP